MIFFISFISGFLAASPVGPMGMLCLRRTLINGRISGIVSAFGISSTYMLWSYAAIHGLSSVSNWIDQEQKPLEIAIGLFFLLYGFHAIFKTPDADYPALRRKGTAGEFFSTFIVVLLNPSTFIMFTALFTLFGIARGRFGLFDSMKIAFFVFSGAMVFWVLTSQLIGKIRNKMNENTLRKISRGAAVVIVVFGVSVLLYCI